MNRSVLVFLAACTSPYDYGNSYDNDLPPDEAPSGLNDTQITPPSNGPNGPTFVSNPRTSPVLTKTLALSVSGSCEVRSGGELWCWGDRDSNVPKAAAGKFVATAAAVRNDIRTYQSYEDRYTIRTDHYLCDEFGYQHHPTPDWIDLSLGTHEGRVRLCGLRSSATDGDVSLWCRNGNDWGQIGPSGGHWTTVEAGGENVCALRDDRSVWCEGPLTGARGFTPMAGLWDRIAVAKDRLCGIRDGALWCESQLDAGPGWTRLAAGDEAFCGIKDKRVWCFGKNQSAFLEAVGATGDAALPLQLPGADNFIDVAVGYAHACAITEHGVVKCWGWRRDGAIGDGVEAPTGIATVGTQTWLSVDVSVGGSCGVQSDGTLWKWGVQDDGQKITYLQRPAQIGTDTDWTACAADQCALKTDGSLWCWSLDAPPTLHDAQDWLSIDMAADYGCLLRADQRIGCFGSMTSPLGIVVDPATDLSAIQILAGTNWKQVSTGYFAACGLRTDNTLWCWGRPNFGQTASGTTSVGSALPYAATGSFTDWETIAMGTTTGCGIRNDGGHHSAWCWGGSDSVTVPTKVEHDGFVSIASNHVQTCAIDSAHALWCWAKDVAPSQWDTDWQSIVSMATGFCGLTTDGHMRCFGKANEGQFGDARAIVTTPQQVLR